jgi:hypothetical protein
MVLSVQTVLYLFHLLLWLLRAKVEAAEHGTE